MKLYAYVIAGILLVCSMPVAAWVFFKPVRILAPEFNGVACDESICVDKISTIPLAKSLHAEAMRNIAGKLTPIVSPPRTVFCSTQACYASFGGGRERGLAILDWGILIPPQSWQTYIVEHELLHMLQAQELGLIRRERTPAWFKEGLPFFISDPPEIDLPDYAKPLVTRYRAWEQQVGRKNVWTEARKL